MNEHDQQDMMKNVIVLGAQPKMIKSKQEISVRWYANSQEINEALLQEQPFRN